MKGEQQFDDKELRASIHQNIEFILKAFTMSYRFDPTFGSIMNKFQAQTPPQKKSDRAWRESIRESIQTNLKEMFRKYETRIRIRDVIVDLDNPRVRKRDNSLAMVSIQVIGHLTLGRRDTFYFPDSEIAEEAQEIFPLLIPIGKSKS